ncbi:N-acetyl-1-D-myo-inositol-2-amino-2-deoxy-alpha-D-glucopyranoside deacetylase [Nakamurella sp. YIM 132087]|uniref:1D-myo-inositol 2-acetamido-2-deoxy-alpha-D-glucopyranoside deacetylase n=1 Tax=Nakamurella alba TaxID=2665158 RepID=A0A7K1FFS5_9ACTN|nr:N-acetyl-1-D-myo-inositol-2-amino-2-deoxy-alpha-D-glucopyranoside deacetylase [Nakamurella alba]
MLAVHAHPDDESITMGGTLADRVSAGDRVVLVTATLGEEGEVIGDELQGLVAGAADQLGGYRYTELRAACAALGVVDHRMLGGLGAHRDSGMVGTPSADHPRAFVRCRRGGPGHAAAVAELVEVLRDVRPDVLLTYDADGGYGHPDHLAAHEVAVAAAAQAGVPRVLAVVKPVAPYRIALTALEVPAGYLTAGDGDLGFFVEDELVGVAVPVTDGGARARSAALAAHATQVDVLGADAFALSNRFAQPLLGREYFRVLSGPPVTDRTDLYAGL